jgi:hypothetical protein
MANAKGVMDLMRVSFDRLQKAPDPKDWQKEGPMAGR